MKQAHTVKVTLFVKPEDKTDVEKYKKIILGLVPLDYEKEKVYVETENVEGLDGRKIRILSLELSKEAHTNLFIKTLKGLLGNQCGVIIEQKESRLDEDLYFYIRLNREKVLNNKFELTDSGDCIHIRLSLAAFPKNKETALKLAEKIFSK